MPKKSNVWQYFTRLKDGHGNIINKARCNYCTDKKVFETKDGTSNLWKHFKKFHPQEAGAAEGAVAAQQPQPPLLLPLPCASSGSSGSGASTDHEPMLIEDESLQVVFQRQFKSSKVSQEPSLEGQAHHEPDVDGKEAIRGLARMIVFHGYDPSVVEDDHFRKFVRYLNPEFKLPSRENIEEVCDDVFTHDNHVTIGERGIHSFAVGTTKSMETREALYITCHFIDDEWNLHRVVDDAYMVLPPGNYYNKFTLLGVPVVSCEVTFERVVSYICDQLDNYGPPVMITGEITGNIGHLELKRCIEQQQFNMEVTSTAYMDHVLHSIARYLLLDSDIIEDMFSNLVNSEWTRQDCQKLLSELDLDDPWEYNERWYWCYCSLKILIHKFQRIFFSRIRTSVHKFQRILSQSVIQLYHLWGDIYHAIKRVSASSTPTSNLCLEELFKVRDALVLWSQRSRATIAAHVPIRKALETVDKAIEDSYLVWSIPLVLDPRYKLRHIEENFKKEFDNAKATDYTSKVTRKIKELYTSYIANFDDDLDEEITAVDSTSPQDQTWDEQYCHSQDGSRARTKTELDHYLEDSPARITKDFNFDILNWWKLYGSVQYPMVAKMAKDALAIPTCSKLTCDQSAQLKSFIRGYARI